MQIRSKKLTGVYTSNLSKMVDLAVLKSNIVKLDIDKLKNVPSRLSSSKRKVDKLNIGKFQTTPVDLSKLTNVVNGVIKKVVFNTKIGNIEYKYLLLLI